MIHFAVSVGTLIAYSMRCLIKRAVGSDREPTPADPRGMPAMNEKFSTRGQIEKRAFEIYVERGCQKGNELANWVAAEKELKQLSSAPAKPPKNILPGERSGFRPTSMLLDFYGLREQPFGMTPD